MAISKEMLDKYIDAYNHGNALIDDQTYDKLLEEYVNEHGESSRPYLRQKQSSAINAALSTLPKVYGVRKGMRENQKTFVEWLAKTDKVKPVKMLYGQPKFDGLSIAYDIQKQKFFTRGDFSNDETSMDVTDKFKHLIPELDNYNSNCKRMYNITDMVSVKFECIMDTYTYSTVFQQYKTARAAASALVTGVNVGDSIRALTLVPLRLVCESGQMIPPGLPSNITAFTQMTENACESYLNNIEEDINRIMNNRFTITMTTDKGGMICDTDYLLRIMKDNGVDIDPYKPLALTFDLDGYVVSSVHENHTDEEVAIKIKHDVKTTKILDVEWCYGLNGALTPDAILEPVNFDKITVTRASLSNARIVSMMKLKAGDTVEVMYNIVPYIVRSLHDSPDGDPLIPPTVCPKCGEPLDMSEMVIRCNNQYCPGRIVGKICRYAKTLGMYGVGESTIQFLYDEGYIKDIKDLYNIDRPRLMKAEGWNRTSVDNLNKSIRDASKDITLAKFLGAMPILSVSTTTWKDILNFDLKAIMAKMLEMDDKWNICGDIINQFRTYETMSEAILNTIENNNIDKFIKCVMLTQIKSVGNNSIVEQPRAVVEAIKRAVTNGVWEDIRDCIQYVTFTGEKQSLGKVCLSGTRDRDVIDYLESKGYEVVDNHSNGVKMLIIPNERFTSVKVIKARKAGIPIYTIANYKDHI